MAFMGGRTRHRTIGSRFNDPNALVGRFYSESTHNSNVWSLYQELRGVSVPFSSVARVTDDVHPGPPWRSGGPFEKIEISLPTWGITAQGTYLTSIDYTFYGIGNGRVKYIGGFSPPSAWPGFNLDNINLSLNLGSNSPWVPDTSSLDDKVWDRTKPRIEQGGLTVALGELRDVPRMLKTTLNGFVEVYQSMKGRSKERLLSPKKIANHFLNHNFGWIPFISDLSNFCDNIIKVDSRIERLMRDNGNWVKREVILVNNIETNDLGWGEGAFVYPSAHYLMAGCYIPTWNPYYNVVETVKTLAKGIGRFRYYQPYFDSSTPDANSALGALRRQLALHGARLTPVNVYRMLPWTWLADWTTNSGNIINAIQDANLDGMVAKYLYLTHHQFKEQTLRQFLPFSPENGGIRELQYSRIIDVKQRKEADAPFGFGLSWDDLSPKQLAILAALGVSRG